MSLVFTLAMRNLFQDRLRFIASLMGIVFSVVLVMVQTGLYFGFSGMITTVIDHTPADLWIVSSGTKYFEDLSLLSTGMRDRILKIEGVSKVVAGVAGFSAWRLPDGAMTSIFIIGTDPTSGGLSPWNVVEGTAQSLTNPRTVAIDRSYYDRLGVSGVGATAQIRGLPVTVGAVTDGIRSFTTTPYVFSDLRDAWAYTGLPASFTSHFLVRLKPEADIERTRQNILSSISGIQALTPDQFREQSRSFWLFRTGAGAALVAGALLGVIVGTVIVAQTLYSSTKDHLYEFATLRAMGASNSYIYQVIICQALVNAIIGFGIAALIGNAVAHFTAQSALQVVITPGLMAELFGLTIVMCIVSAISAIRICGTSTSGARPEVLAKIRRQHIGFVFQSYHLFSTLTAVENVRLALDVRGERGPGAVAKAEEILASVGLRSKLASFPRQLSGGEQQRVAIARAIVAEPSAILADEPTAALDAANGQATMAILSAIAKERGRAVLVVTHDPRLFGFADRIVYIEDGTLRREQSADLSPADAQQR